MKRAGLKILILLVIAGVSLPLFSIQAKLKRTLHPKDMYDHTMHTELFNAMEVPCESCHVNDEYEWAKMNKTGCHNCHKSAKYMEAPNDCSMCHANWQVIPPSHREGWKATHRAPAKADAKSCKSCHADRFCINCHQQRSTIQLVEHKRNYRYFHSVDVRSNPGKCGSCHVTAFCTNCHSSRRGR